MHADPHRWLPARLVWRWGALLWIGPLLGLMVGLVLVFGLLKKNYTMTARFVASDQPVSLDQEAHPADLRSVLQSERFLIEMQRRLDRDGPLLKTPLWWIRARVQLESVEASEDGFWFTMRFNHHDPSGPRQLFQEFEALAMGTGRRERERSGERDQLVSLTEQPFLGRAFAVRETRIASRSSSSKWWSLPDWAVLIGMCAGYGLMAVFPAVILLEQLWPRRHAPESAEEGS